MGVFSLTVEYLLSFELSTHLTLIILIHLRALRSSRPVVLLGWWLPVEYPLFLLPLLVKLVLKDWMEGALTVESFSWFQWFMTLLKKKDWWVLDQELDFGSFLECPLLLCWLELRLLTLGLTRALYSFINIDLCLLLIVCFSNPWLELAWETTCWTWLL